MYCRLSVNPAVGTPFILIEERTILRYGISVIDTPRTTEIPEKRTQKLSICRLLAEWQAIC